MSKFERAAIYADLADSHMLAYFDAKSRGDEEAMRWHWDAANGYFQDEHDCKIEAVRS